VLSSLKLAYLKSVTYDLGDANFFLELPQLDTKSSQPTTGSKSTEKINYIITDTYKHSCCTRNDKVVHFEVHHLPVT